ncbi:MAG: flagellar basal body L-ring protein FlgH [Planctomycetota bacterium]|nr:flagellar basal body L-ring protein FlgH [Planctomycetota bacterium]MCZ6612678.1 flagellar basal body L-ring protein FlgH [Planctomycetota bacterium]
MDQLDPTARDPEPAVEPATSSLLATATTTVANTGRSDSAELRDVSMFAVASPAPREFQKRDLIQIVVRETRRVDTRHRIDTEKEYNMDGKIAKWPDLSLSDSLDLRVNGGRTTNLPQLDVQFNKEFAGDGRYPRQYNLTARLTAEVIEVLPNGSLVIEARTHIKTDEEESTIKVTGICRPEDVTAANTILSNQLHDLKIEKMHEGELKKANEKGIIAKVLDTIFAF